MTLRWRQDFISFNVKEVQFSRGRPSRVRDGAQRRWEKGAKVGRNGWRRESEVIPDRSKVERDWSGCRDGDAEIVTGTYQDGRSQKWTDQRSDQSEILECSGKFKLPSKTFRLRLICLIPSEVTQTTNILWTHPLKHQRLKTFSFISLVTINDCVSCKYLKSAFAKLCRGSALAEHGWKLSEQNTQRISQPLKTELFLCSFLSFFQFFDLEQITGHSNRMTWLPACFLVVSSRLGTVHVHGCLPLPWITDFGHCH